MKKKFLRFFIVGASALLVLLIIFAPLIIPRVKPGLWVPFFLSLIFIYLLKTHFWSSEKTMRKKEDEKNKKNNAPIS